MIFCIRYRYILFGLLILSAICQTSTLSVADTLSKKGIKVGIYDNPPKLFLDDRQTPKGIFPGIISTIAQKEGWTINFIPVTFKQGLNGLKNGSIDIMQDVAWSSQRSQLYGFTTETVMVSWGRVYKRKGLDINTLIDLKGKRIAIMDGGIYSEGPDGLKAVMEKFEFPAAFIPVEGYSEVFEAIHNGRADAGIVNRLYGKRNKNQYHIENTPILISPISIRFAFSKSNPDTAALISRIDHHLIQMKQDSHSVYYQLIDEYLRQPKTKIPDFLKKLLWALLIMSLFFATLWIVSTWQAQTKTKLLRKRDKALKDSEKKFRTIFESLQDVYFKTSLDGKFIMLSPSVKTISGYTPEELTGQSVDRVYHDINDRRYLIDRLLKHKTVRNHQVRLKHKYQGPFWASINADLFFDENDRPQGMTGILRDITNQKQAEELLTKREERFREMARLLPSGIVETDLDLNITYANQAGLDMFEYTKEDLRLGFNGIDIVHPEDWERIEALKEQHLIGEPTTPAEYRMQKKNGVELDVLFDSTPILSHGEVVGFRGSMVDLTEIKQLQKEVIRNQKLESTGLLAGGIAHDFNNILLGLFGNLSLAKNELDAESKAYHLIDEAGKSMSRAKDLTTQLLTFAKGGDPVKKDIPLDQVVRETALFHLSGSNIRFQMEKPEVLWQARADKGQIGQVISNLVINARQSMPQGGLLSIKIENAAVSDNDFECLELDRYVKLTVTDQGTGISEKYLDKIFDPYFTTKQDGSGLGLAIVHSIILKHQGYIYVNSALGQGTSFVIYLPSTEPVEPEKNKHDSEPLVEPQTPACKILIMDDDPLVREVSKRMLKALGHQADLCEDGESAILMYEEALKTNRPFDLVIMDLTIPGGLGGRDTIKKLLAIDPSANVVVASGYSNDPVMAFHEEYGFKAMLSKPYTVEKINTVIYKALSLKN